MKLLHLTIVTALLMHSSVVPAKERLNVPIRDEVESLLQAATQLEIQTSVDTLIEKVLVLEKSGYSEADIFGSIYMQTRNLLRVHPFDRQDLQAKLTLLQQEFKRHITEVNTARSQSRKSSVITAVVVGVVVAAFGSIIFAPIAAALVYYWISPKHERRKLNPLLAEALIRDLKALVDHQLSVPAR